MRSRISGAKRKKIILISAIVLIVAIIAVVLKVNSLTRNILNNDRIAANVRCVASERLSGEQIGEIKKTGAYKDNPIEKEILDLLTAKDNELCVLTLEFIINNLEEREITNLAMNIIPDEKAMGKVYYCSPLTFVSKEDSAETYHQTVILNEVDVNNSFLTEELPLDFSGPFKYELSYEMKGQYGRKSMVFSTAKR